MQKRMLLLVLMLSASLAAAAWAASPRSAGAAPMTPAPTPLATIPAAPFVPSTPPLSLTVMLAFTCCALSVVLGLIVLSFVIGVQRRKGEKPEKQP